MALVSWCPRCPSPVAGGPGGYACDTHGPVIPLWRALETDYHAFTQVVDLARAMPTYVPWPQSPGWSVVDAACVADGAGTTLATMTATVGSSSLDGEMSVSVVSEEPGVGLGARVAGLEALDPGSVVAVGPPTVHVRVAGRPVALWQLPSGDADDLLARSVFAGEADGRWMWLVLRPASAALLLRDEWLLADAAGFGPEAVEMAFGGPAPAW